MADRLEGKLALVTGASSGLGRAIAERFASEGAAVAVAAHTSVEGADETVRRVRALGADGFALLGDVADVGAARRVVDEAAAQLGGLDIVVNNAGHFLPPKPAADYEIEAWDRIIAVNLRGPFLVSKFAIPHLLARGGGVLLGIGSVNGIAVWPGDCAYNASKAGLHMLAKTIAIDYATQGIRSNCICPATIGTEGTTELLEAADDPDGYAQAALSRHPMGRFGRADEIASLAVALCCDDSSYVTGALIPADGGYLAV